MKHVKMYMYRKCEGKLYFFREESQLEILHDHIQSDINKERNNNLKKIVKSL